MWIWYKVKNINHYQSDKTISYFRKCIHIIFYLSQKVKYTGVIVQKHKCAIINHYLHKKNKTHELFLYQSNVNLLQYNQNSSICMYKKRYIYQIKCPMAKICYILLYGNFILVTPVNQQNYTTIMFYWNVWTFLFIYIKILHSLFCKWNDMNLISMFWPAS